MLENGERVRAIGGIADARHELAMRLFIGIKIASTLANKFVDMARPLGDPAVRLIRAQDIHLTLVPPWRVVDVLTPLNG